MPANYSALPGCQNGNAYDTDIVATDPAVSRLWINSVRCSLPMTVFEAPKSTTPLQPCETNTMSTLLMDSDTESTLGSSFLRNERLTDILEVLFPLTRSLIPLSATLTLNSPKQHSCNLGSSSEVSSWTCGKLKNSRPRMSSFSWLELLAYIVEAPLTIEALAEAPLLIELALFLSGHSAFQCPTLLHKRRLLDKMRSCNDLRLRPPLPFPKAFPLPLPHGRTGQNPRLRKRSDNRLLASWYAVNAVASSLSSCTVSLIAASYSVTRIASSSPSWANWSRNSSSWSSSCVYSTFHDHFLSLLLRQKPFDRRFSISSSSVQYSLERNRLPEVEWRMSLSASLRHLQFQLLLQSTLSSYPPILTGSLAVWCRPVILRASSVAVVITIRPMPRLSVQDTNHSTHPSFADSWTKHVLPPHAFSREAPVRIGLLPIQPIASRTSNHSSRVLVDEFVTSETPTPCSSKSVV